MKNETKRTYLTPQLTVVQFRTERGYAISSTVLDSEFHLFEFGSSDPNVTQYNEDDSWAGYSWN
ncbi:MAG: hypothetical protein IKJ78_02585 [Bacteroidales bacterium]|nr:hypothetical protein [Bacteroidales bacterium]